MFFVLPCSYVLVNIMVRFNFVFVCLNVLDPIMFADGTNLFYTPKDINTLFLKVNNELHKINQWFISNKLSLNIKK